MKRAVAIAIALVLAARPAHAQGLTRWLGDLSSPQPTTYRIAAAYVAHAGPAGLDSLDAWPPSATATMRAHVKLTLDVMLLASITPDDLARHPKLRALAADEFAAADRHAKVLCASNELEHDIGALSDSTKAHYDGLVQLGGWGVPAAVALTHCAGATGRVLGARALADARAGGQTGSLTALAHDSTVVIASEEEQQGRITIAELAGQYVAGFPFSNHVGASKPAVAAEAEEYLNAVVRAEGLDQPEWKIDNRLRDDAPTAAAASWEEYWLRARPVLLTLWEPATAPTAH